MEEEGGEVDQRDGYRCVYGMQGRGLSGGSMEGSLRCGGKSYEKKYVVVLLQVICG